MTKLASILALGAFAGVANAECPNACSGNGICVQYDMCQCYRNWQGNDCSERTCPFGYAHVDSPLGDMDMSGGELSGPATTVVAGSEVFPMGTTEQYPDALTNEAHFYMECSNKGLCDRKSGDCECFDGYDGAACERASCPGGHGGTSEQCSGHGTCHSIASLTEKYSFEGKPLEVRGSVQTDGSYSSGTQAYYGLWDKNTTRGCACDSPYVGADCSSRACKVGIDPLFSGWAVHNQPMIMVDCVNSNDPMGTFSILFTDALGQTYRTAKLDVSASASDVENALLALPNGVVPDVTVTDYSSFTTGSSTDIAFMINFPANPGARAGLQIDTSDIDCGDFDLENPVVFPNVGFRQVGSDADDYVYHAADIAFAKNGHRLLYVKSALPAGSDSSNPVVKIEDKLYVVEDTGELVSGGLAYVILHTPFEGADVDGDSAEQNTLLSAVSNSQVTINSNGHLDAIFLTDDGVSSVDSGSDLDGDGANEAKDAFFQGEYYLLEFDIEDLDYTDAVSTAGVTGEGEYCIVYIAQTQSATDATSTNAAEGTAIIGPNLEAAAPSGASLTGVQLNLQTSGGANTGINCPIGYEGLTFTDSATPTTTETVTSDSGVIPTKMTRFYLQRENAVSSKYQSTHAATGGALLKSAYSRITSQTARGTTRVYYTAASNYQTATAVGDAGTLDAVVGESFVTVTDSTQTGNMGDIFLVGTERNVASEDWDTSATNIQLQNLFTGSGEDQLSGASTNRDTVYDIDSTDKTHLVTLYKVNGEATMPESYVQECSGRGNCDGATGTCKCFKGYTNDNCDSQSALFGGK
jgi:hypothetical protein